MSVASRWLPQAPESSVLGWTSFPGGLEPRGEGGVCFFLEPPHDVEARVRIRLGQEAVQRSVRDIRGFGELSETLSSAGEVGLDDFRCSSRRDATRRPTGSFSTHPRFLATIREKIHPKGSFFLLILARKT